MWWLKYRVTDPSLISEFQYINITDKVVAEILDAGNNEAKVRDILKNEEGIKLLFCNSNEGECFEWQLVESPPLSVLYKKIESLEFWIKEYQTQLVRYKEMVQYAE